MGSEYVRISKTENYFAQKNLLHSQLELLDIIKRIRSYRLLRNQELLLKLSLKQKVKETIEELESLNKILPVSHFKTELEEEPKKDDKKRIQQEKTYLSLQEEIELIQEKLARLQESM